MAEVVKPRLIDVDAWERISLRWARRQHRPSRYLAHARDDGTVLLVPVDDITGEPVVTGRVDFTVAN